MQQFAAEGGDDYELLVALPSDFGEPDARAFESATGIALTRIGAVEPATACAPSCSAAHSSCGGTTTSVDSEPRLGCPSVPIPERP